jgi:hypothetical protein
MPPFFLEKIMSCNISPFKKAVELTLHDTNTFPVTSALYVGGAGGLKIRDADGNSVTFAGVPAGTVLRIKADMAYSTGSTATSVVALYD